jgi:hypothetical protein
MENTMTTVIRPKRLKFHDEPSAGCKVFADVKFEANCVEFTMKAGWQPIMEMCTNDHKKESAHWNDLLVAHDLWIQFPPTEYVAMKNQLFREMVDAWNEKYATGDKHEPG